MYKEEDQHGRLPVSMKEYEGLRTLFGVVSMLPQVAEKLGDRAKGIPNVWRDIRLIERLSEKVMEAILYTVPAKKLLALRAELDRTRIIMTLDKRGDPLHYVVDEEAVMDLVENACEYRCFGCTIHKWWECPTLKAVKNVLPYELPKRRGNICPLLRD